MNGFGSTCTCCTRCSRGIVRPQPCAPSRAARRRCRKETRRRCRVRRAQRRRARSRRTRCAGVAMHRHDCAGGRAAVSAQPASRSCAAQSRPDAVVAAHVCCAASPPNALSDAWSSETFPARSFCPSLELLRSHAPGATPDTPAHELSTRKASAYRANCGTRSPNCIGKLRTCPSS